jgi:predicted HTH domain antitoxin
MKYRTMIRINIRLLQKVSQIFGKLSGLTNKRILRVIVILARKRVKMLILNNRKKRLETWKR